MILRLIGPNDEHIVNYWMEDEAPSVIHTHHRVWVRAANSIPGEGVFNYYEQKSARWIPESFLIKVDKHSENPTV